MSATQSVGDISSLFVGEDSFKRFTADMVRQFMHDELLRTEHQAAMLRLREKALHEKAKTELAWISQQKHNLRKKGLDDAYPRILKQEKMIKKRQKEQEVGIQFVVSCGGEILSFGFIILKQEKMIKKRQKEQEVGIQFVGMCI